MTPDDIYRRRTLAVLVGGLLFLIVVVLVAAGSYHAGATAGEPQIRDLQHRVERLETEVSIVSGHVAEMRE